MTDKDEAELIKQAQEGDQTAFNLLLVRYQLKVTKLVSRYVKDPSEALDVTQEVFIKVFRALPNFRGESAFYTWLYRVTINTAKNYLIHQERRPPHTDIDYELIEQSVGRSALRELNSPERMMIRDQVEDGVFDTLDALPEELRVALILREIEGFSYDDIADVMGCPVGTVRSRIYRAREVLEKKLFKMHQGDED